MKISVIFEKFHTELNQFADYVQAHHLRLRILAEHNAELQEVRAEWNRRWTPYANVLTRTEPVVRAVHSWHKVALKLMRALRMQMKYTYKLDLNPDEHVALRVQYIGAHRRRAPALFDAPDNRVIKTVSGRVEFRTFISGRSHDAKMPPDAHEIMREVAYVAAANPYEYSDDDFHSVAPATTAHHHINPPYEFRGKKVGWLRTRFVNNRGQMGPASNAVRFAVI